MRTPLLLTLALVLSVGCCRGSAADEADSRLGQLLSLTHEYLWQVDDYYWHRGDHERCISILRLITRIDPHDTQAYGSAAWLIQNQLRDDEAEALLIEGLAHNRDVHDLYFELGFFYYMRERFDEAIAYLESAVLFDAEPRVWHVLAHSYELAGDPAQSLNIWAYNQTAEPENPVPIIQIERIVSGGDPPNGPAMANRSRKERMRERHAH